MTRTLTSMIACGIMPGGVPLRGAGGAISGQLQDRDDRHQIGTRSLRARGGPWPGRGAAARLWRNRRHVDAARRRTGQRHTVVVPDLRGMGLSVASGRWLRQENQAGDIAGVLDALGVGQIDLVAHDIGNMVGLRLRRAVASASRASSRWTPRSQASAPGTRF